MANIYAAAFNPNISQNKEHPMTSSLSGKVALVTGGSGGIGAATARKLASQGAAVGVHYFSNADSANAVVAEIEKAGGRAIAVGGNIADAKEAKAVVEKVADAFGKIDILVNNAGTIKPAEFGAITTEHFQDQFGVNFLGVVLMTQEAVAKFPASGGRVVSVSSNLAFQSHPTVAMYSAAKAAVVSLTETFAKELGPRNITVNAVAPGAVKTEMIARISQEALDGIAAKTPLGRIATPEDIADTIAFFASDDARWITGRTILVDGGVT
jgi:3-oxoacyl-[acyl-carrier protein] reductase